MKKHPLTGYPSIPMILLAGLLALAALWEENRPAVIKEKMDRRHEARPTEKVYAHLDRLHYSLGDTAWFKIYLLNGQTHQPSLVSKLVYVELLNPEDEIVAARYIHTERGTGAGDLLLDKKWPAGEYVLRAYTHYMRNFDEAYFFRRTIRLWNAQEDIRGQTPPSASSDQSADNGNGGPTRSDYDLQFFPEGGDLVDGLSSVVAFKAIDETGRGVPAEGVVLDENDQMAAFLKTIKFGMGFFSLRPQPGQRYRAEVMSNGVKKTFPLPVAQPQGYVLKIKQRSTGQFDLEVQTNLPQGLSGAFVIGHLRGQVFCTVEAPETGNGFAVPLPVEEIPDGVAHFTLFSGQGLPVCERLVFIDRPENACQLKVLTDKPAYGLREKVEIYLDLADAQGQPLIGNFSLAVTDLYSAPHDPYGEDIRTYLLLNSELKGYIENPAYFFEDDSPGRRQLLNLLLLTHGWRRFKWEEILAEELPPVAYAPEQGFSLTGYTSRNDSRSPVSADLFVTTMGQPFLMEQLTTGDDGRFGVHGVALFDTTTIVFQANVENDKRDERRQRKNKDEDRTGPDGNRNVSIRLDERTIPGPARQYAAPLPLPGEDLLAELLRESRTIQTLDSAYRVAWSIELDEVTVRAKSKEPTVFDLAEQYYEAPDNRFLIDSFPNAISQLSVLDFLKGRVPGLDILGTFPTYSVRIRGNSTIVGDNTPLFVLDGTPIGGAEAIERIITIPMNNVAYIDVIKGLRAQGFGQINTGGVIAVYTRGAVGMPFTRDEVRYPGILEFAHPGYYRARTFYSPAYDAPQRQPVKPDYRTTLFWAPELTIDGQGYARLSFYTSDKASSYRIVVEGMTADGRPVRAVQRLEVTGR